jgi:vanillate O-demethylase ferredoxin subunit
MGRPLRAWLLPLHRWTGLVAGLAFLLVALTGAAMAVRPQLEAALAPTLLGAQACARPLPLDALVERARGAGTQAAPLRAMRLTDAGGATWRVRFGSGPWVYVDPCSGHVAGSQAPYDGLFGSIAWLHILGFLPAQELAAGGVALLFLLSMLGAGAVLWRPTLRALAAGLRPAPGLRGRARMLGLHRSAALYATPVLLASALTGLPQAFHWGDGAPPSAAAAAQGAQGAPARRASLQQMWEQAQRMVPNPRKTQIRFPAEPGAPVSFEMVGASAPHANALSYVRIDPGTARLRGFVPYAAIPLPHRAWLFATALHYGWIGGIAGQLLLLLGALAVPLLAWTGTASYLRSRRRLPAARLQAVVVRKSAEAQDVCAFELAAADGGRLPRFAAGAHIDVHLPNGLVRQYSLCGDPRERRRYRIAVLRVPDSRGGSRALHEQVQAGDRLEIGAPRNHFGLAPRATRSLLFAGGIGITPIIAMAEALARAGADFELHYCCRSPERAAFAGQLAQASYARHVHFHYSEGEPGRRADLPALLAAPGARTHLYVCGPDSFMNAVAGCALAQGWRSDRVHREHFAAAAPGGTDLPFDIRIASSGALVHVAPGVSALRALAACGVAVPSSCEQGLCGTCLTGVLDGEPDHRDLFLDAAQRARNDRMALCCSRARSQVVTLDL